MCHYKVNNKENTELVSESRILHLHNIWTLPKILYSALNFKSSNVTHIL